jgi:hypothetical protein
MKYALAFVLTCYALCAQEKIAGPDTAGLQPITNPKDERINVFRELEAKAALDDTKALAEIGRYYCNGQFPVLKNIEKGKAYLTRGSSLGNATCATLMWEYTNRNGDVNDPDQVIEANKWRMIASGLRGMDIDQVTRPSNVSESSFEEAKARASTFLAGVKVSATDPKPNSKKMPGLMFESLSLFDAHRKNVCSAYMKAASPIYNKGEAATADEKAAFTVAAAELARLQSYIGKSRRLSLSSKSNAASRAVDSATLSDCYAKMSAAKIATSLPATRAELNEASIYINGLGKIMQLNVSLGRGY